MAIKRRTRFNISKGINLPYVGKSMAPYLKVGFDSLYKKKTLFTSFYANC